MALTESTRLPPNFEAPNFSLRDTDGNIISLAQVCGAKGTLIMFICNHCPYVQHLKPALAAFARDCQQVGVGVIAINANDIKVYPDDSPEKMADDVKAFGYSFPYLFDASQDVARAYQAACTPDFYLFDKELKLAYRGQFDDSRPGNEVPVTGNDLRQAVDMVVRGEPVPEPHKPSIGCNIKWKK